MCAHFWEKVPYYTHNIYVGETFHFLSRNFIVIYKQCKMVIKIILQVHLMMSIICLEKVTTF